jgi:uncharacterized protein (DUF885 family)
MPKITDQLCQSYLDLRWHLDPVAGSFAGATEYDNRLGQFGEESIGEYLVALRSIGAAVEDLEVEDLQDEIDRTALLGDIRVTQFRFESERPEVRNPSFWLSHLFEAMYTLLSETETTPEHRAAAAESRFKAVPEFLQAAENTLAEPPSVFLDSAIAMLPGGESLIAQTTTSLGDLCPDRREALREAADDASAALSAFGESLRTDLAIHPDEMAFAAGEDEFEHRLHYQHALSTSAPELWRYGMHLQDEVTARIESIAAEIDPGVNWRDLVDRLRGDTPSSDGVLEAYQDALERARSFTIEQDIVAMPNGTLELGETPEFMRPLIPLAAYLPPGPLMQSRTGKFFVTVPDADDPDARLGQLKEHCVWEIPTVAVHETYPGHHLQILTAQQQPSLVRQNVWTPLMVEGWAMYCEDLVGELGFYPTAEAQLFQQVMLLWRAVRVVLDVGLHTRGMTPPQAVDYMVDHLPLERASAEAEVRRYCAMPTYQLCYAVGRRDLLSLRDAYRERAAAAFTWREFHDELLSYGGLPLSLSRWVMGLER